MEKIVIISEQVESDNTFILLLNALFPTCDIQIVSSSTRSDTASPVKMQQQA
ncbi:MAG: hypothetical protein JJE15_12730 [Desulfobacteraceae bacterium]|nr:hypothetical protein [Desulfobacteraceae bacterium]